MGTSAGAEVSGPELAAAAVARPAPYEMTSAASSPSGAATGLLERISELLSGYVDWDGVSDDAASSEADDLEDQQASGEYLIARDDLDLGYPVYPNDLLGRDHHNCKVWGLYKVVYGGGTDGDWWPEAVPGATGLTVAECRELGGRVDLGSLIGD